MAEREHEWLEYYDAFDYFSPEAVRDGCHPRKLVSAGADRAVILVHGLTDSPYFVAAIGEHFHKELGYDVYIPLLHCHGLKEPRGMEDVELEEWKRNVRFAIGVASSKTPDVSIGGLSTGGALAFFMSCTKPRVTGDLFLFSAALDLSGGKLGVIGELKERLLLTFLPRLLDTKSPLIGANPYRYARMDMDGAKELARLIKQTDDLVDGYDEDHPLPMRIFAAHSEADDTADIAGIERLQGIAAEGRFHSYCIPDREGVEHASLVLKDPVRAANGDVLEAANPHFDEMMAEATRFVQAR